MRFTKNKRRKDPRYFLNEMADHDETQRIIGDINAALEEINAQEYEAARDTLSIVVDDIDDLLGESKKAAPILKEEASPAEAHRAVQSIVKSIRTALADIQAQRWGRAKDIIVQAVSALSRLPGVEAELDINNPYYKQSSQGYITP